MVIFSAAKISNQAVVDGEIVEFTDVVTNIGNAYSSATSTFTCPYSGMYVFRYHMMSISNICGVRLNKDSNPLFGAYSSEVSAIWLSSSNSMYVECDEGSEITVRAYKSGSCHGETNELSSFSGQFLGFTSRNMLTMVN